VPRFQAGRVEDIPPGHTRFFCFDGKPVLVANRSGEFFALHGMCPHRGHSLEGAQLWDHLIDCPWHHFEYDVRTGENYFPKNVYPSDYPELQKQLRPLPTYRVELKDSEIWVEVE
jgi:nitrite reductase/ring-hydroxylating ferredoxin subunit